jgi:transcription elongation factor GreA
MTRIGSEALRRELKQLKSVERPKVIQAIAEARAHGDLSENAEYEAAKEQQGFIEGRIREIETKLSNAQIIEPETLRGGRVMFGATVTLADEDSDDEVTYQIVGEDEANLLHGKISITSPVARALIGKEEGDSVDVRAPGGIRTYEILKIVFK